MEAALFGNNGGGMFQVKKKREPIFNQGSQNLNQGWNQQPQTQGTGWGGQQPQQNSGWGGQQQSQQNSGWGGQQQPQQNSGWGQQPQQNSGWGQQPQQNSGWGGQQQPQQNSGWGGQQQPQQNSGWGEQGGQQNIGMGIGLGFQNNGFGNQNKGMDWVNMQMQQQNMNFMNPSQFNLEDVINNQVILLEPSPAKQKLDQLRAKGQKFEDQRFPPNQQSLSGQWGKVSNWNSISWDKIQDKMPGQNIFSGRPSPRDIKQGYLGNCYFLAGLAALAERPDRIFNLFLLQEKNELNYYSVKMLYKGKWMTIDMDEYIPFMHEKPAFSKSVDDSLWVIILEKAWSKMYTSYKRTEAGYPQEPLHDLTGAPIKQLHMRKNNYNKQEEWQYLLKASKLEYSMVCSSNPGSDANKSQSGVVQGHAYTLLNAIYLNYQGQQFKLIQLRNPWGKGEFKGQWSDFDPNWDNVDPNEKRRVGFSKDSDDGIFFMTFDEFWSEFRAITIAEINDNASYVYKSHQDKSKTGCYFKIQIGKQGEYALMVDKTPERSFEDKRQNSYNYPRATVDFGSYQGSFNKIESFASSSRTTQKKLNLSPGTYLAKVVVDFDPSWEKQYDVNLAVYSEYGCVVKLASQQQATAVAGTHVNWTGEEEQSHSWNNLGGFGFGQNNSGGNSNNGGNDGWGGGGNNANDGWGGGNNNTGGGNNSNNGWGGGGSNNTGGNNGWGNSGGNSGGGNSGWGGNQGGWGNSGGNSGGGSGWDSNNNGW